MNDQPNSQDAVDRFAAEAARFERWLFDGDDRDAAAAREALIRLLSLYRAALDLPPQWSEELQGAQDTEDVSETECRRAAAGPTRLPFDMYREVFDPLDLNDEKAVVGSLADDLVDIYRDIASGLRAYEKGDRAIANWEWAFHLHAHWGEHATGAIRALHCWLAENAIDQTTTRDPA